MTSDRKWEKIMEIGTMTGCHQMPERSFFVRGYQFPVCARCTGVFLGKFIADIMLIFKKVLSPVTAVVMLLIMGADWFAQRIGVLESTNARRFVTGILGGMGVAFLYANAVIATVMRISGADNKDQSR